MITELGHQAFDMGTDTPDSVDYPDYGAKVAQAVSQGEADRGILICGTGMGMCITANKFPGVRACSCHDDLTSSDLVGRFIVSGGDVSWNDGPLTRAVKNGAVCYLDEVVEARHDSLAILHLLTDHRP